MMLKSVLLFFALSLGLGVLPNTMLSFAEGKTAAQAQLQQDQTKANLESRNGIFEVLTKIVYVVLWPLIALAGLAMDNQLVYGSFMYLDAPLRKVRNIVKNLANFFLGFIFLAGILIYAISPEKKMERGVIKGFSTPAALIKKTLIAGVLIQLSRFIMMVLVDISTILTYTVGTIPTTVLSSTDQTSNYKVMGMSLELNMGDAGKDANSAKNEAVQRYATLPGDKATLNIAPCESVKRKEDEKEKIYLLGRKYDSLGKGKDMAVGYCTYLGALVSYQEIEIQVANNASWSKHPQTMSVLTEIFASKSDETKLINELVAAGIVVDVYAWPLLQQSPIPSSIKGQSVQVVEDKIWDCLIGFVGNRAQTDKEGNLILNEQQQPKYDCIFDDYGYTASDMLEKVQSWTGPFVALYSSLVTSASFDSLKTYTVFQKFIVLLVNAAFALILILPLVGLVVVLLWRIMMLWIVIAISPFLVLKKVFSEMLGNIGGKEADYLNPGEVIKLLLAPVLVGFALSISLMFMSVLKTTFPESPIYQPPREQDQQNKDAEQIQKEQAAKAKKEQQLSELWGMDVKLNDESGEQEFNMLWFIKILVPNAFINFSRFLTMLFGLAITWFLMFWAVRNTRIGAQIGGHLEKLGTDLLATTPIIPTSKGMVGFGAMQNSLKQLSNNLTTQMQKEHTDRMNKALGITKETDAEKHIQQYLVNKEDPTALFATQTAEQSANTVTTTLDTMKNDKVYYDKYKDSPEIQNFISKAADRIIPKQANSQNVNMAAVDRNVMDALQTISQKTNNTLGENSSSAKMLQQKFEMLTKASANGRVVVTDQEWVSKEYIYTNAGIDSLSEAATKLNDLIQDKKEMKTFFTKSSLEKNITLLSEMYAEHNNGSAYWAIASYLEEYQKNYTSLWEQVMDHTMDEDQKVTHLNLLLNIKELSKRLPQDTHPLKKLATASGEYKIGNKTYILRDDQLISPSPSQS